MPSHAARLLAAAALAVLTACGTTEPPAPPQLLDAAGLALPLDAYQLSTAGVGELTRGYGALLRRCLARYGATLPAGSPTAGAGPRTRNERRYGLTEERAAAARGYRPAVPPAHSRRTAVPPLTEAILAGRAGAVAGKPVPPGGCAGEARRALTAKAPPGADTGLAERLSADSFVRSRNAQQVRAATAEWARCMAAAGFHYRDPFEPAADARFRGPLAGAEIATATADVACKRATNLVGIWFSVESTYQDASIAANADALTLAARALAAQLATARAAQR
jgi:hypothetical protein